MFKVREWERFQFLVDYEHHQVPKIRAVIIKIYLTQMSVRVCVFLCVCEAQENTAKDTTRGSEVVYC